MANVCFDNLENSENSGTEEIGLLTPTPGVNEQTTGDNTVMS